MKQIVFFVFAFINAVKITKSLSIDLKLSSIVLDNSIISVINSCLCHVFYKLHKNLHKISFV